MNEIRSPELSRYQAIIPDWDDFVRVSSTPEPTGIRVRTGTMSAAELRGRLERQGFTLEPVGGLPSLMRVLGGPRSVAQTLEHWLGHFHIQQTVMALPSLALAPAPGERVLDLCAAPGGKTTHLAELMGDRGPLVAVDPKEKRLRGLLATVFRLGHPNVLVVAMDGRDLPTTAAFDRVLVDAPCSAEGTLRKKEGLAARRSGRFVSYVTELQEALLRKAIQATRPGGTIVYSTCTFAPEENEAVLSRVLHDAPVRMEEIPLDLPHSPGLAAWDGARYHPDANLAWRVYPHQMDSGGLFMARLRRLGAEGDDSTDPWGAAAPPGAVEPVGSGRSGWSRVPTEFPGEESNNDRGRLDSGATAIERWFPSGDGLAGLQWLVRGDNLWAHTAGSWPVPSWVDAAPTGWRVVSLGLRALRQGIRALEAPSNHFLIRFGSGLAPDRKLRVDRTELSVLLTEGSIPAPALAYGAYALEFDGFVVGRATVGADGLRHEIPKAIAARLREVIANESLALRLGEAHQ